MLYREIIAVCSQIHTKHINTLCGQNVELLNVKLAVYLKWFNSSDLNSCNSDTKPLTHFPPSATLACYYTSKCNLIIHAF
jgi:hypothetical protein